MNNMSSVWSWWIIILTLGSIAFFMWLLFATRKGQQSDEPTERTMGHSFDGIEEYDNPLPLWWFYMFVLTVIYGVAYLFLYPGLGNFPGLLGWSSSNQYEAEVADAQEKAAPIFARYAAIPADQLMHDAEALKIGSRLYGNNCAVCHGSTARGSFGFPNLTDDNWLYGGTVEAINHTLTHGRQGQMPPWQGVLSEADITNVATYVRSLSHADLASEKVARGSEVYKTYCAACHGTDGAGNQALGAPNLTDDNWLYGGTQQMIVQTLRYGRAGVMPAQKDRLSADQIHLLTGYVYSLSQKQGGE